MVATTLLRLQYDGTEGALHKRYKSAPPGGAEMSLGADTRYTVLRESNQWQTVTFDVTDGVFMNSQNGGADFRFELSPPEIYVRRVTVARSTALTPRPESNPSKP